ncbi:hypothetical protein J3Q64DRAFT_1384259 [Phycomyces blakesleeanus]|uniref:BTB domain-containing protein n=1 Tax=Phycomyces blakesleeanus TaxID=4837 RepID=A0ABR3AHX6_PHYBL
MDSVVGTVDPYQYRWSVLDYSNIPFGSSLKSPIFHILNYRWYMQVNKGLDDEPRYLGVRLFLEGTYPTGNIKGLNPTVHVSSFIEKPRQGTTDAKNIKAHYAETFNEQHPSWGYSKFILLNSVKNYLEDDRLHICVKIREKIRWKIKYSSCHPEQVPFYVNNPSYTLMIPDITVHVSSEDTDSSNINEKTNTITIPAHKEILAASSVYLKTLIIVLEPFNRDKLFIRGVDPGLFVRVLRHCYIADAEIVDIKDAIKLADIAYRFQLNNLMIDALYYLRMRVNVDNIWDIWYISDKYNCNYTYDFCKAFVRHNCRSVLESSSWVHADKNLSILVTSTVDN